MTGKKLFEAIKIVERASEEFVKKGFFKQGVLNRLRLCIKSLPMDDVKRLANEIAKKAAATDTGTGADINGVALDEVGQPSLESLVLYYNEKEPGLFPPEAIEMIKRKLIIHGGPKYKGPWP